MGETPKFDSKAARNRYDLLLLMGWERSNKVSKDGGILMILHQVSNKYAFAMFHTDYNPDFKHDGEIIRGNLKKDYKESMYSDLLSILCENESDKKNLDNALKSIKGIINGTISNPDKLWERIANTLGQGFPNNSKVDNYLKMLCDEDPTLKNGIVYESFLEGRNEEQQLDAKTADEQHEAPMARDVFAVSTDADSCGKASC